MDTWGTEVPDSLINIGCLWQWTWHPVVENHDKNYHLLSTFYMPGPVLGTFYIYYI